MNQFDLWASPMRTVFTNNPPRTLPAVTHVPAEYPLTSGTSCTSLASLAKPETKDSPKVAALRAAWLQKKTQIFAGKLTKPDAEDPSTVNHYDWYEPPGLRGPIPVRKPFGPRATSTTRLLLSSIKTKHISTTMSLSPITGRGFFHASNQVFTSSPDRLRTRPTPACPETGL